MKAIAIATTKGACLPVLAASITFYVPQDVTVFLAGSEIILPRHSTINLPNDADNFGDAYNAVVKRAFEELLLVIVMPLLTITFEYRSTMDKVPSVSVFV